MKTSVNMTMASTKILIPAFDFKPSLGGVAHYGHELAMALAKAPGVELQFIAREHPDATTYDKSAPFKIHRYRAPEKAFLALPFWAYAIGSHLTSWKPDLVFCPLWFPDGAATYLAKLTSRSQTPYVMAAHGSEVNPFTGSPKLQARLAILAPLIKQTFQGAKKIFAVSHFTREMILKFAPVESNFVSVANNGVNIETFSRRASDSGLREKYNLHGRKVLLTVSRLHSYKGIDKVLESLPLVIDKVPNLKYLIVGHGPDVPRLKKLVEKRNLQNYVEFLGVISHNDIIDLYNIADLFILMTREQGPDFEGFGLVFLEAAACGLPSIGGASGGIPDAFENGRSGWLVPPQNIAAIADKISTVLRDDEMRHAASQHCLQMVKARTWESTAKIILGESLGR